MVYSNEREVVMGKLILKNSAGEVLHVTVAGLFFKGEEILLIEKSDPAYNKKYSVIAGHVEENELIENALKREINEEIGLDFFEYEKIDTFDNLKDSCRYGAHRHTWHVFKINSDIDINNQWFDKSEINTFKWVKVSDLKNIELTSGATSMFQALGLI